MSDQYPPLVLAAAVFLGTLLFLIMLSAVLAVTTH